MDIIIEIKIQMYVLRITEDPLVVVIGHKVMLIMVVGGQAMTHTVEDGHN